MPNSPEESNEVSGFKASEIIRVILGLISGALGVIFFSMLLDGWDEVTIANTTRLQRTWFIGLSAGWMMAFGLSSVSLFVSLYRKRLSVVLGIAAIACWIAMLIIGSFQPNWP